MDYKCSPENSQYIRQVIERGDFSDESSVVNEALRLMKEHDRRIADLRREVQLGIHSGPSIPGDEVFERLERKARELVDRRRAEE